MTNGTVCITYHFDAVSPWLASNNEQFHRWGLYGAEVGAPRMLDLHDELDVPATWFIPGQTVESFPEICRDIHERGYEIQHHGGSHKSMPSFKSKRAERKDFERGITAIEEITGQPPTGFSPPGASNDGGFSPHTIDLLEEYGFEWYSSYGVHDFKPYRLYRDWTADADKPYDRGEPTDIVEIPTPWHRDDMMHLFPRGGPNWVSYSTEQTLFDRWRTELDWMIDHIDDGVFTLLLHPQTCGRAPFLAYFEPFLEELQDWNDIRFAEVGTVAAETRQRIR
ncbi:MAG: polysaccharide deacetylase family protein [Halobacteriales archaeon]|nr:polysaccharide deacetylase family protein [Halobacteriales archaeon]